MSTKYYYLSENEENCIGWLGGNSPEWFDDKKEQIDEPDCHYGFYCTFVLEDPARSLSVFIPEKFDFLIENNIYPNCSIKAFIHPTAKESTDNYFQLMPERPNPNKTLTDYQKKFDYSQSVFSKTYIVSRETDDNEEAAFLTVGDDVFHIQNENFYWQELIKDGYRLWGYINEEGYYPLIKRIDFIHGNMPLAFGAMYLYKRGEQIIVGYWQYS